jgi:hypothetical protein
MLDEDLTARLVEPASNIVIDDTTSNNGNLAIIE